MDFVDTRFMEAKPSAGELEILEVLWHRGQATVREVFDELSGQGREIGYTTVLKQLQIMREKGLVSAVLEGKAHIYTAQWKQEQARKAMLQELATRFFDGSMAKLALGALSEKRATKKELAELRALLGEEKK